MFSFVKRKLSDAYGIDLGTHKTLIYKKGRGIVVDEPSCISVNKKTYRVVSVGEQSEIMRGRTPAHVEVVSPVRESVISDFANAEKMLEILLGRVKKRTAGLLSLPPYVVVNIPIGITNVETVAVMDIFLNLGIADVYIIENTVAGAIGIGESIYNPSGIAMVDMGAGTTDISVISLGGIINAESLKIAGNALSQNITEYIRQEFGLSIGFSTAEKIKKRLSTMYPSGDKEQIVRGRDIETGNPKEVVINDVDIYGAIKSPIDKIIVSIKRVMDETPPEILSDIMMRGINIIGGTAHLRGIDKYMEKALGVPVSSPDDPDSIVARGIGAVVENMQDYENILQSHKDDLPFK